MQPYFFPYIGYFQLIAEVDQFVIFDDVNFIKKGWINRNRILVNNGEEFLFTLPLEKVSQNSLIKDISISDAQKNKAHLLKTIFSSYKKATYFEEVKDLLEEIIMNEEVNLAKYIANSLKKVCALLEIKTRFISSKEINYDSSGKGQDKILSIIKKLGANSYYNLPGGEALYEKKVFEKEGIELNFIRPVKIYYEQFGREFIPYLSVIDMLMFMPRAEIHKVIYNSASA